MAVRISRNVCFLYVAKLCAVNSRVVNLCMPGNLEGGVISVPGIYPWIRFWNVFLILYVCLRAWM